MRALVCHRLTSDRSGLAFEPDWPEPLPPAAGEVTVAVAHAALNYPDVLMLAGGYQYAPPLPFIPGVEGSGHVVAVGAGVDPALLGRAVVVGSRFGLMAERITVARSAVRPLPEGLDAPAAAAFTVAALTAYVALVRRGRLQGGERVAIVGAGGGTGLAAVALTKRLDGQVLAIASSSVKLHAARTAGADELHLVPRGAGAVPLADIDIVFDPVGGNLTLPLLACLRRGGRYLTVGFPGGIAAVPFDRLLTGIEIVGVRAGEYGRRDPAAGAANLAAIDDLAAKMVPVIGFRTRLDTAAEAFRAMADGTLIGKAVIDCA